MPDIPGDNRRLAALVVDSLCAVGCSQVVLSPGARSAPLALAIAAEPKLQRLIHFDERGAAFLALGCAKRREEPVAIVCTSGTAVANLFPAIVEASLTATPLVVLTSDRPARLRGSGANQTITQPNIFGEYAIASLDLHSGMTSQALQAAIRTSMQQCIASPRGVIHLNCQFDEPLVDLNSQVNEAQNEALSVSKNLSAATASSLRDKGLIHDALSPLVHAKASNLQGVTLLGALAPSERVMAAAIARWLGFPVIADIQSALRDHSLADLLIPYHASGELLTRAYSQGDLLVHLGGELTSRRTLDWLRAASFSSYLQYRDRAKSWNPYGHLINHIHIPLNSLRPSDLDPALAADHASKSSLATMHSRKERIQSVYDSEIPGELLTEAGATRVIWETLPTEQTLFLASSMPIRCYDLYADVSHPHVVISNRGASGIDGTIATAVGVAMAEGQAITVVIGDLALLHDLNSLALAAASRSPLTIVVFNNHGGGIFAHLPLRTQPHFEELFVTPHAYSFEHAAAQFGLFYHRPASIDQLRELLRDVHQSAHSTLIELELDWQRDQQLHQRLQHLITAAGE